MGYLALSILFSHTIVSLSDRLPSDVGISSNSVQRSLFYSYPPTLAALKSRGGAYWSSEYRDSVWIAFLFPATHYPPVEQMVLCAHDSYPFDWKRVRATLNGRKANRYDVHYQRSCVYAWFDDVEKGKIQEVKFEFRSNAKQWFTVDEIWYEPRDVSCPGIRNEATCVSSIDRRTKFQGQPCVWCCGNECTNAIWNRCEPLDFLKSHRDWKGDGRHNGTLDTCGGCGGEVQAPGTITSHGRYRRTCSWLIEGKKDQTLRVKVTLLELRSLETKVVCHGNYVVLYDGPDNSSSPLATLCGIMRVPVVYTSTSHQVYIQLHVNRYFSGWNARGLFSADIDTLSRVDDCGGEVQAPGTVTSHGRHNRTCNWRIEGNKNQVLRVSLTQLKLDDVANCSAGYFVVHDGPDSDSPTLAKLCKTQRTPVVYTSTSHHVYIRFYAQESQERGLFANIVSVSRDDGSIDDCVTNSSGIKFCDGKIHCANGKDEENCDKCIRPKDANKYDIPKTKEVLDVYRFKLKFPLSCAVGYKGEVSYRPCRVNGDAYELFGCHRDPNIDWLNVPEGAREYSSVSRHNNSRLNSTSGWSSAKNDLHQYMILKLPAFHKVMGIASKGLHNARQYVSKYEVKLSLDRWRWSSLGNFTCANNELCNNIFTPQLAKYVKIIPLEWHIHIIMRVAIIIKK